VHQSQGKPRIPLHIINTTRTAFAFRFDYTEYKACYSILYVIDQH